MIDDAITITAGVTEALRVDHDIEDVTGWTFAAQLRPTVDADTVIHTWTPATMTSRPLVLLLHLDPTLTDGWTFGRAVIGVEATSPTGEVRRLVSSRVRIDRSIVR